MAKLNCRVAKFSEARGRQAGVVDDARERVGAVDVDHGGQAPKAVFLTRMRLPTGKAAILASSVVSEAWKVSALTANEPEGDHGRGVGGGDRRVGGEGHRHPGCRHWRPGCARSACPRR